MTKEIRDVTRDKKLWRTFFVSPGKPHLWKPALPGLLHTVGGAVTSEKPCGMLAQVLACALPRRGARSAVVPGVVVEVVATMCFFKGRRSSL